MAELETARAAFAKHEWAHARDCFVAARDAAPLGADDLACLREAAWWLGLMDESRAAGEEAYALYVEASENRKAAYQAWEIAYAYFLKGDEAVGSGWMGRAQRLLVNEPDCAEQGYVLYFAVESSLDGGEETLAKAKEVQAFGRRNANRNLTAAGMVAEGRVMIKLGRAKEGLALLDEGMLEASSGEMSPLFSGNVYCHLIAACHELGDVRRASAWTQITSDWCDRMAPAVLFKGICRVHRVEVLQLQGAWTDAEAEAVRVCTDVAHIHAGVVAEARYQLGEIKRLRGDLVGAEDVYQQAHASGRDPQPGLALLRLAQGRPDSAATSIRSALAGVTGRLARARLLPAAVEIAIAVGDDETAAAAADELHDIASAYGSSGFDAAAKLARGAALLAAGRTADAVSVLRTACTAWQELDAPYDCARVRVLLARAYRDLGDNEAAARELDAARSVFDELGAELDAKAVETQRRRGLPKGLTEREVQVLALVAEGSTNRQIADELVLSQKTIARHVSNIFTKLGVTTRTAAAWFAFENGIASPKSG
jgi:DNA-binding CsgD family transcriptional regulator